MSVLGQLQSSPVTIGNVRSSQDPSFRVRKLDIASPLTGMRTIAAVPEDRPMFPFIATVARKVPSRAKHAPIAEIPV
jgi:hypothetical protein